MTFHPHQFFDLETYPHKALFEGKESVWEVLSELKNYMDHLVFHRLEAMEILSQNSDGIVIENPQAVFLGKDVHIEKGSYIKGPCWIGEGTVIRSGAYIREHVLIGKNCVIGHGTEIKHSIFLNDASASHFNYVGDSILGNGVHLGAGAKCANLRFDHREISIFFEGQKWRTGLKKMGAILGDKAQMGCNAVSNPGTIFFPQALCAPCRNVGGVIISSLTH